MRIAFPTDEHRPYHDPQAIEVAQLIVQDFDPDLLISGSDGMDFYAASSFDKDPKRLKAGGLQEEIDGWKEGQRAWRDAAPRAKRKFLPGNHEDRLRKHLWRHPELADLEALSLENLLDLKGQGIEYVGDYGQAEIVLEGRLVIKHGLYARKLSGFSARAELEQEKFSISVCTGHTHRGGSFFARTRSGIIQAHECFCLCKLEPEYVQHPDWQQGIALIEVTKSAVQVELVPINTFPGPLARTGRHRKIAIFRGKEYAA